MKGITKKAIKNLMLLQLGDVPATHADVADLMRDLDYKPDTQIQEGIDKFIDWVIYILRVNNNKFFRFIFVLKIFYYKLKGV